MVVYEQVIAFRLMYKEYGNIVMFPAMLGRPEIAMAFNPEDYEKVVEFKSLNSLLLTNFC